MNDMAKRVRGTENCMVKVCVHQGSELITTRAQLLLLRVLKLYKLE